MKIFISSDHGGFDLKQQILQAEGRWSQVDIEDLGPFAQDPDDDYPKYAFKLAERLKMEWNDDSSALGILICRSGNGMVIAANKARGIRAALCFSTQHAQKARGDDHANVLVLDSDYEVGDDPMDIIDAFINAEPDLSERHVRRVKQITDYEQA